MKYYAMQVKTRGEEKYIRLFKALNPGILFPIYFPQRQLYIRRRGKTVSSNAAVFPGYIFVEVGDDENILDHHWAFRKIDGFFRFLKSNQNIMALAGKNLELVLHFIKKVGPLAGRSKAYFDENDRIVILEGPLLGLEGKVIKVDKRKGRAKIKLDLYDDSFSIDLAFENIKPSS